ncbi:MAG: hypothetical protein IJU74_01230 [Bacteroidales bacterium]|jgi:hypothetical protein|nr:hypothetical protein [Bacteroidales bacterium]MBQ2222063.1 hypothetical protein [Bacteroidales bacterium]MBQ7609702.1 hypothetical protein [Bacteroidales bacterium]MBR1501403.1 hypothetical protein [Bacteroidales bacterium]MBR1636720.1 hypothetical protein [Bacteroidales bacterium]
MKYLFFLYYIMGLIAVGWGIAGLVNGEGKTFTFIAILLIGVYFLGRGIYLTVHRKYDR